MVGIITFIIPIIYLANALFSLIPKTQQSETHPLALVRWCNSSGVLALAPPKFLRAVRASHISEAETLFC